MNTSKMTAAPASNSAPCYFCETVGEHKHYAVKIYDGKTQTFIGRLGADGYAVTRNLFAVIFSKNQADKVASQINADGEFIAQVAPF